MWTSLISSSWLAGFTVCLSLIISIGAQNLYVLRQAVQGRHVRACVAWCVLSDALLIAIGVAGMSQLIAREPTLAHHLSVGGALFLLAYGLYALWRVAFAADVALQGPAAAQRGLLGVLGTLAVITLFNPHVYLDTVLLVGSIGARQEGALKSVFVAGAACASLLWFALLASAGRRMQHWFAHPLAWRVLDGATGLMMLALAWWVWSGSQAPAALNAA
ncbi:LysE/ArgO family amino acid transporter [Comamonas endophytica]|uniref:LysE family transporter n=1 Tax=Comamonas endophytica TaxID=2949090 RepID=A0ABY6GAW2_9BURK|nr:MULTISPECIES: LysE family transporter [unclassified Acidovorax]MCD2513984.1 LysE family transporter [Acidovorax sp. D4N7]UYG52026.1 LysE family transporter [Acidovorax sp. 5MLIR]